MSLDLDFVEKAAVKAGELLLSYYGKSYRVRQKGADNPVTAADLGANTLLRKVLMARFPNDGWLSEESELWIRFSITEPARGNRRLHGFF